MKTTRIDIEGPNGTATIIRDGRCIEISGHRLVKAIETKDGRTCVVRKPFRLLADAWSCNENYKVARDLQQHLDGSRGTNGDVAEYRRAIAIFED
jgi:hypothetical protein